MAQRTPAKRKPRLRRESRSAPAKTPLVFISHDSRDAALARHFARLLAGASGGGLKSFRASDRRGAYGIEYGREWYRKIMAKLRAATDVVVLLTPSSLSRPWVVYEAGFAKGFDAAPVFGVILGVPPAPVASGPFTQFQNCESDEESLTQLVIQLVRHSLRNDPPEDTVRHEVREFRKKVSDKTSDPRRPEDSLDVAARIYEEVKLIARDLHKNGNAKLLGPELLRQFPLASGERPGEYDATGWLMLIGVLRDDLPWIYEVGLELYRALVAADSAKIERARERVLRSVRTTAENDWLRSVIAEGNRELAFRLFHLPDLVENYLSQIAPMASKGKI
jgi:hypothetical protein